MIGLMVTLANSILKGEWLGEFGKGTLIKGVTMPLFLVLLKIMNIPYLLGKEIFYCLACMLFALTINKAIKNKVVSLIIYLLILLNPVEYSNELCRVYRDSIYISLILYLLTISINIFLDRDKPVKKQILNYVLFRNNYFCNNFM